MSAEKKTITVDVPIQIVGNAYFGETGRVHWGALQRDMNDLSAAGYAVCDEAILQMALLVLCAAEKGQDWHPNFRKDITCVIDGLRATLAASEPTR